MAERSLFEGVRDAVEGLAAGADGELHTSWHRRGVKVWYDDAAREHYEAQLIRLGEGRVGLEIGFHAEHREEADNDAVLARLVRHERAWRRELGSEPEAGAFLGADRWRRISEVWDPPDPDDPDAEFEIAARLADYILALEPVRRG
ncbi:MAG: hypothetical protein HKN41_00075 [Ilumatobacter sp.]|nr:hypothetical protein [Ilumatobacter sp.]